jgi:hypothetical protein
MSNEKTSFLHLKCTPQQKATWVQAAKASNMKLVDWVESVLMEEAQAIDTPPPEWMGLFSSSTAQALQRAMILKPGVLAELVEASELNSVGYLGPEHKIEIQQWYNQFVSKRELKNNIKIK